MTSHKDADEEEVEIKSVLYELGWTRGGPLWARAVIATPKTLLALVVLMVPLSFILLFVFAIGVFLHQMLIPPRTPPAPFTNQAASGNGAPPVSEAVALGLVTILAIAGLGLLRMKAVQRIEEAEA